MRPRMFVTTTLAAAGLLLAGCSGSGAPVAATRAQPTNTPVNSRPVTASSSSAPASSRGLGVIHTITDDGVTESVQATGYQVITLGAGNQEGVPAGSKVELVSAKACVIAIPAESVVVVQWLPWTVQDAKGDTGQPLSTYGTRDFPGPLYENDVTLSDRVSPGQCRSGLIPFDVKGLGAVTKVVYRDDQFSATWTIG